MRYEYDRETDILVIRLSEELPDYGEQNQNFITHYSKNGKPVEIEILDARRTVLELIRPILATQGEQPGEAQA